MDSTTIAYANVVFSIVGIALTTMIVVARYVFVNSKPCAIVINERITKTTNGGSSLLDALIKNGISIPASCGGKATCKQCKLQIVEGNSEALEIEKDTFSKKQIRCGWRLACQFKVKSDIKIRIKDDLLAVKEFQGTVVSNYNVATFIKELVVKVDEDIPYRSGGFLQIHVPKFVTNTSDWKDTIEKRYQQDWQSFGMFNNDINFSSIDEIKRAYSMASYPAEGKKIMFNIRIAPPPPKEKNIPWGICSSYIFSLKPGDSIKLSGPYGESFMVDDDRDLIFLIGGAGSSFGRSHIMHLFKTENTKRNVTLWYGARSIKENIYQEEYEALENSFSNFSYHLVLSDPQQEDIQQGWNANDPVKTNFLFKAFEEGQLKLLEYPEEFLYYVCGPPMHNASILKLLENYGVPRESIILDDFGS